MTKLLILTLVFCVAFAAAAPHIPLDDGEELDSLPIAFEDDNLDLDDEPRSELEPLEDRDDDDDDEDDNDLDMLNLAPDMRDGTEELADHPVVLHPSNRSWWRRTRRRLKRWGRTGRRWYRTGRRWYRRYRRLRRRWG